MHQMLRTHWLMLQGEYFFRTEDLPYGYTLLRFVLVEGREVVKVVKSSMSNTSVWLMVVDLNRVEFSIEPRF